MQVYTVISPFSLPQLDSTVAAGAVIGKYATDNLVSIDASAYYNLAFYNWVGSDSSIPFMTYLGVFPDVLGGQIWGGTAGITSGLDYITVTGANLPSVPSSVSATVSMPDGSGTNIGATVQLDTVTADGFVVQLTGTVPTSGYVLNWIALTGSAVAVPPAGAPTLVSRSADITMGDDTLVVTGLGLASVPVRIVASVVSPVGGQILSGAIKGALTADGFTFKLSAAAPMAGYRLDFILTL